MKTLRNWLIFVCVLLAFIVVVYRQTESHRQKLIEFETRVEAAIKINDSILERILTPEQMKNLRAKRGE